MGSLKVKLDERLVSVKLKKGMRVIDLMRQLCVNRETHLAKKNGKLVSELEGVSGRDRLEIFQVVYGG